MEVKKEINGSQKKLLYLFGILAGVAVILVCTVILYNTFKPKVDYDSLYREIDAYTSQIDNIVKVEDKGHGAFAITLKSDSWYAGADQDKLAFCKHVNQNITYACQKYRLIKDTHYALIYYYDEDGINIAEPSKKGYDLESKILH